MNTQYTVSDFVKGSSVASFTHYVDGNLWYSVNASSESYILDFPIPIEDCKGGVFTHTMKAITLMRWIRKHLNLMYEGKN